MKNQIFFKLSKIILSKLLFILICTVSTFGLYGQNVQMTLVESWENSTWENSGRSMNTYDSNNYLITIINQTWDVNSSTWENAARTLYTNNINGTVSLLVIQIWDKDTNG